MSNTWMICKPPHRVLVEVLNEATGEVEKMMAIHGGDGQRPCWSDEDEIRQVDPGTYRMWRHLPSEACYSVTFDEEAWKALEDALEKTKVSFQEFAAAMERVSEMFKKEAK